MLKRNNFPAYSIHLYCRENVKESCLRLQDEYDLDVNAVLFCYWYGVHYGVAGEDVWARVDEVAQFCQSFLIRPMRQWRRELKNEDVLSNRLSHYEREKTREWIKNNELYWELIQQRFMQEACEDCETGAPVGPTEAARRNAVALIQRHGIALDEEIRDLLAAISSAAFS